MSVYFKSAMVAIAAIIVVASATMAVFVTLARAGHAHEYEITGHNANTGERVAGTMTDTAHNGTVHGLILDRLDRVPVGGRWSGRGMARLSDGGVRTYKVEVVE